MQVRPNDGDRRYVEATIGQEVDRRARLRVGLVGGDLSTVGIFGSITTGILSPSSGQVAWDSLSAGTGVAARRIERISLK